jgi:polyphosphate kinase
MEDSLTTTDKIVQQIDESNYISRDLSWLKFNYRVLDQAKHIDRSIFDRLKFLSITASNLDEFCTIRLGSLYNYIDYGKERFDYNGLREEPFRMLLLSETQKYYADQNAYYVNRLKPLFQKNGFAIVNYGELSLENTHKVNDYFNKTIYPMLTPMVFDSYHTFPVLMNNRLLLGVVTKNPNENQNQQKVSFIQVPQNH